MDFASVPIYIVTMERLISHPPLMIVSDLDHTMVGSDSFNSLSVCIFIVY